MRDLLSKEHYWYKIHTLLMKSSAYPLLQSTALYGLPARPPGPPFPRAPSFLQENLDPPSINFKNPNSFINKEGIHTMLLIITSVTFLQII